MFSRRKLGVLRVVVILAAASTACRMSPQEKAASHVRKAEELIGKKDFSRAVLELRNAVVAMPKDPELHYRLGAAYLDANNYGGAVLEFRTAIQLNPNHQKAQLKLAELMTATRNQPMLREAQQKLEGVLKENPGDVEAMDTLARSELLLGDPKEAARTLDEVLQKAPANLRSSVALAQIKLKQKDYAAAEEVMKRAVAASPKSADAALAFGQLYILAGRFDQAEPQIRRALQLEPKNPRALMSIASLQIAGKRLQEAEQSYQILSSLPDNKYKPAHAIFLYQIGQRDRAVKEFEKLVHDNPEDRQIRDKLIKAYVAMGQASQARVALAAALKSNPKDVDALLQLSELDIRSGDTAGAEAKLTNFLHLVPDSAQAHLALSRVYAAQGLARSERQELEKAVQLDRRLVAARVSLAKNMRESHQLALALETIDATPEPYKRVVAVLIERNWILLALQKFEPLKQGIAEGLGPGRLPEFVLQDGVCKMLEKDYPGARADAEELIARNPEDIAAARLLVQTYIGEKAGGKGVDRLRLLADSRPKSAALKHLLGEYYLAGGNRLAARQAFDAALAATPGYLPAMMSIAEMEIQAQRLEAARAQLEDALRTNKNYVPALLLSARVEKQLGNYTVAVARYRSVLNIDGSNLEALNNLAYTIVQDDLDGALKLAQNAAALAPNDANVMDTLGLVYYRKGLYTTAIPLLKSAFDREPTPRHRFHLGLVYLKGGEAALGRQNVELALQQDPTLKTSERLWF